MPSSGIWTFCYRQWELRQVLEHRSEFLSGSVLSQVQTRSADEPMTTFVLCNECGNRWKVCMSVTFSLPCHPQLLPHIRNSIPTAKEGGFPACRAGDSGGWLLGRRGESACACFCWGSHPAGVGAATHILSQDGQVCHLSTDAISLLRSTEGRKNNSTLHLGHTSLQSSFADAISFEPCPTQPGVSARLSPVRGRCHQVLPGHLPFIRQLWKSPKLPKTVIWAAPAPAKAEVLF